MIVLLLIHLLSAQALPVPAVNELSSSSSCKDLDHCRSLISIVWSCITTILLCTWVAIHPNVPEPVDMRRMSLWDKCTHKMSRFLGDKAVLFICALLVPEYILAWAIRQRLWARKIVKKFPDLELTETHAFFIIMGGFHYFEGSDKAGESYKPVHPLTYEDVASMLRNKAISLPTEGEMQDKSKSDWLAKTIVLLQTLWFVMQCLARLIKNLPSTELEVVTLAYTAINVGVFIAWWDKPRNVNCPIRIFKKPTENDLAVSVESVDSVEKSVDVIIGQQDRWVDLHTRVKVPIFYAGKSDSREIYIADSITLACGVVFGAIHCIAWSFHFSSHTEAFWWRASSVAITVVPVSLLVTIIGVVLEDDWWEAIQQLLGFLLLLMPLLGLLYVAARLTTLVLAFMNLATLPPGAFQAVHWTTLILHL